MTQPKGTISYSVEQDSGLLFSLTSSTLKQVKPLLEGSVSAVTSTADYHLCTLRVEPFGAKIIDFRGASKLPLVGEVFLVSLSSWTSNPSHYDFSWISKAPVVKLQTPTRYDRLLTFTKFNAYSVSVSFRFQIYRVRSKSIFFPLKKGAGYCYPSVSNQFLFLPRNLQRTLARHRFLGFTGILHLLTPLLYTSRAAMLNSNILFSSNAAVDLLFAYEGYSRTLFLYRFLRSCSSKRIRKIARVGLSALVFSQKRFNLRTRFLPVLNLNFFTVIASSFLLRRSTLFSYYLLGALTAGGETTELLCNPFLYYLKFSSKYSSTLSGRSSAVKFHAPLLSSVPQRRKRPLRRSSRRYVRYTKTR